MCLSLWDGYKWAGKTGERLHSGRRRQFVFVGGYVRASHYKHIVSVPYFTKELLLLSLLLLLLLLCATLSTLTLEILFFNLLDNAAKPFFTNDPNLPGLHTSVTSPPLSLPLMFLSYQMQGVLFLPPIIITTIPTPSCTPSKLPLTHVNIPPSTLPSMTVPPSTVPPTTGPFTSLRSTTAPPMIVSSTGTLIFAWTLKIQATCWTRRRYCTPHSTAGYMNAEL